MKWFYNLKVGLRLYIMIGFLSLLLIIVGIMGIRGMILTNDSLETVYNDRVVPLNQLKEVSDMYAVNIVDTSHKVRNGNITWLDGLKNIEEASERISDRWNEYTSTYLVTEEKKLVAEANPLMKKANDSIARLADIMKRQDSKQLTEYTVEELYANIDPITNVVNQLVVLQLEVAKSEFVKSKASYVSIRNISIASIVIGIILVIIISLLVIRSITRPIKKLTDAAEKLAQGDVNIVVESNTEDEIGRLAKSFGVMTETIKSLIKETNLLIAATQEGKLDVRGNAGTFEGSWGGLVGGINKLIDAFVGPINVTAEYVDRISKGDIPPKITDTYYGDFNEIKNNINMCIDAVNSMITDVNGLTKAAIEGQLDVRADASKHQGDFKKIVEGINNILNEIIEPVKEASAVLQEMAKGNLSVRVAGNYKGDHAEIKDALNFTLNNVIGYIEEISHILNEMSNGNLDVGISRDYNGDFAQIKDSINLIIKSFNEVLGQINVTAEQVTSGSKHVSNSSQALSQASAEQSSSVEEITSSMTQMGDQTKQNAVNANQANELALSVKDNAAQGNSQMKEMLKAMEDINVSSNNISKIIKVIDEIAFQTNILALNAAVEAARAGQHGKGFAVVAEEVRNLAARSANAAKETTDLIEGSIKKVEAGTTIANGTAEALDKIVNGVTKVSELVGNIAIASNEQATGISQVNQAIDQVSRVTQQNAATAEESASASEELSTQAELLKDMVKKFKLKIMDNSTMYKNYDKPDTTLSTYAEAAATTKKASGKNPSKIKIALDDKEFGKY